MAVQLPGPRSAPLFSQSSDGRRRITAAGARVVVFLVVDIEGRHEEPTPDRQGGDEVDDVTESSLTLGLDEETSEGGVDGKTKDLPTSLGEHSLVIERPETEEVAEGGVEGVVLGWIEKGELLCPFTTGSGGEHQRGQCFAVHLWWRRALEEGRLVPEPDAEPRASSSSAACTLLGAIGGDGLEREVATTAMVGRAAHESRVDDHADTGYSDRCLRHVGREDHLSPTVGVGTKDL
jgi:hypothetical protein